MRWGGAATVGRAFDQIQARFNTAYIDLKKILWELGSNVDGIAVRQGDLEQFLKQRVCGSQNR